MTGFTPKSTIFLLSLERSDVKEEYDEAEEAVNQHMGNDLSDAESGLIHSKGKASETRCDLNNVLSLSLTTPHPQIVFKTFIMVFFAEWGDRSQFSTIALAGTHPISSGTAPSAHSLTL